MSNAMMDRFTVYWLGINFVKLMNKWFRNVCVCQWMIAGDREGGREGGREGSVEGGGREGVGEWVSETKCVSMQGEWVSGYAKTCLRLM